MNDWGRNRSENYKYQAVQRAPSRYNQNRKPPHHGNWQPSVPQWERNFCTKVCRVPWGRILESQKVMYIYKGVVQWDDSAAEEAFHNAKARYWADINNFACDLPLPDPNMYIDEIDWEAEIDPELLLDLEREPEVPAEEELDGQKTGLAADTLYLLNQPVVCSGWGDADDEPVKTDNNPCEKNTSNKDNPWESNYGGCNKNDTTKRNPWMEGYDDGKANPWEKGNLDGKPRLMPNAWGEASWCWGPSENTIDPQWGNNGNPQWGNNANPQWANIANPQWENNANPQWENNANSQWTNNVNSQWTNNANNANSQRTKNANNANSQWTNNATSQWGNNVNSRWGNNANPQWGNIANPQWENNGNSQWANTANSQWANTANSQWANNGNSQWGNNISSQWENNINEWENPNSRWNENWRKREVNGQYLSRYKTTRFQGGEYHADHGWRDERGKRRVSFAQEHPPMDKKPLVPMQWNPIQACGPTNHHRSGNSWGAY